MHPFTPPKPREWPASRQKPWLVAHKSDAIYARSQARMAASVTILPGPKPILGPTQLETIGALWQAELEFVRKSLRQRNLFRQITISNEQAPEAVGDWDFKLSCNGNNGRIQWYLSA